MRNNFPVYIPSKGRWDSRYTARHLDAMGVDYYMIVEEQEYPSYAAVIDRRRLLVLDKRYQDEYDTCDALGDTCCKGPGPARNFAWDHAVASGAAWHWVVDDNIRGFYRLYRNRKIYCADATPLRCMEDFVSRYENIAMAGPNYNFFAKRKQEIPPYILNTRIYSCNLIRNDVPFRWRARYNEDTDLSLCMLKGGWCTVQFNAFLQNKAGTQTVKGGNTDSIYIPLGTLPKSQMLARMHFDVARLVFKFGRWHHHVDYSGFKHLKLIRKPDVDIRAGVDNYGLQLVTRDKSTAA